MKALTCIEHGKYDTMPLMPHRFGAEEIEAAYQIFENKLDWVVKIAVMP